MAFLGLYLTGVATIIGLVAYVYGFNHIRIKYFNAHIQDPWDYMLMPFLAIIVVMLFLAIPLVIGEAVMSHF